MLPVYLHDKETTPTRCVNVESVRRSWIGLILQLMLRLHAALRRTQTLERLRQCEEFVFWVNSGIICIYKAQRRSREREREKGGGATVLSFSFVAIGPPT